MTKKILLIIGILVIIGVALFLIFGSRATPGTGDGSFSIRDYMPFGSSGDASSSTSTDQTDTGEEIPATPSDRPVPRLRKISSEPVAGAVIFNIGTTSVARFVEKGTGNVYEARSDSVAISRLTNTTIPKIIRAFWLPSGNGFLAQTLEPENEIIETSFVKLNKNNASSGSESLTPFSTIIGKLPTGIKEITIKPDSTKILYYIISGSYSNWYTANPDGTGAVLVMTHPLTEWLPKWISGNTVIMQIKASSETTGYTYSFDVASKILKKVGVETSGLSANPKPDGSLDLISSGGILPRLLIVDNKDAALKALGISGLAEKCVWLKKGSFVYCATSNYMPGGNYPDIWYKGLVSTEDSIKKIDLNNDIVSDVAGLTSLSGRKIDVVDPGMSPDETHLIFRNKIDGYLWMLRIGD